MTESNASLHPDEPHASGLASRLNWLRAGVLGANDGIVSTAGVVVGVAGATNATGPIFTAGLAALTAGAVSMALGEYVSVSSQRDTEKAQVIKEMSELEASPEAELRELASIYEHKGLKPQTALQVAQELTAHDALAAHLDAELNMDARDFTSPHEAAAASAVAFTVGAVLPLLAILVAPAHSRVPVTVFVVLLALALAGVLSARISGARVLRPVLRVVVGGGAGLLVTYEVGRLFGAAVR